MESLKCAEATSIQQLLQPILVSELVLDHSGGYTGQGKFADFFLCHKVEDKDLPWDITQEDW